MTRTDDKVFDYPQGLQLPPVHPGETLGEELAARGLSANALALKLCMPANRIMEIVQGKRGIFAETALRLGRYFGTGPAFWATLQSQYDLAVAQRDLGDIIARAVDLSA